MSSLGKVVFNERAVFHNNSSIEYCRTSLAVVAGVAAGIMGVTGVYGFLLYLVYSIFVSLLLAIKVGTKWNCYFKSRRSLWTDGIFGGLFTYVLLWTFVYGMIHVF